jgi:hypothetical protein
MKMNYAKAAVAALMLLTSGLAGAVAGETSDRAAPAVSDAVAADLRRDAEHAWKFFERKSSAMTGLASPNIWPEGGNSYGSYDIVTMWDFGSIVIATVSARAIGLIDAAEFDRRVNGFKAFLKRATYTHKKARIPNFRSRADNGASVEAGYDATDTGRLFVALHVLEKFTDGKYDLAAFFKDWNIDATVKDGQISDLKGGVYAPAQSNIYRFYVGRGYDLWNIAHAPVYDGEAPDSSFAARKAFLKTLGEIGPIATEPSLSEIIEIGPSPYATVITEVLGERQQERYEQTGKLTSVSETPIDRAPWFTYQGLDLTREGEDAWTVYPYATDERWETPTFASENRTISTKAAFLWYAVQPNDYTEKVWSYMREQAKSEKYGFHPGVYEATKTPSTNIDLNTNAAILESIAYILNNRKPLVDLNRHS